MKPVAERLIGYVKQWRNLTGRGGLKVRGREREGGEKNMAER